MPKARPAGGKGKGEPLKRMQDTAITGRDLRLRMVNKFFLQEINAHGCMRRSLGRGSVATMRMLKQPAGG